MWALQIRNDDLQARIRRRLSELVRVWKLLFWRCELDIFLEYDRDLQALWVCKDIQADKPVDLTDAYFNPEPMSPRIHPDSPRDATREEDIVGPPKLRSDLKCIRWLSQKRTY